MLGFSDFVPHVGTQFDIVSYDPPVSVELIEVAELNETEIPAEFAGHNIRDEPFRLLFMAPQNVDIPQGVYALEHDEMEPQIMLLVPVDPATSDGDYQLELEAVFAWNWFQNGFEIVAEASCPRLLDVHCGWKPQPQGFDTASYLHQLILIGIRGGSDKTH